MELYTFIYCFCIHIARRKLAEETFLNDMHPAINRRNTSTPVDTPKVTLQYSIRDAGWVETIVVINRHSCITHLPSL